MLSILSIGSMLIDIGRQGLGLAVFAVIKLVVDGWRDLGKATNLKVMGCFCQRLELILKRKYLDFIERLR